VRNYGAKGDGVTNDRAAIQAVINQLQPGDTLYFPAGKYLSDSYLAFNHKSNVTITGDGASLSEIHNTNGMTMYLGTGGEPGTGLVVQNLKMSGNTGSTMKNSIPAAGGIQVFGPTGTIIRNCEFDWVSGALQESGSSTGTVMTGCTVNGWNRVAVFCNGGERVNHCTFTQLDPDVSGEETSHAFYIHSGCTDVEIADCEIANVRKYAAQVYGESVGTVTSNIRLLRLNIHDCENGIILAHSQPSAAVAQNVVIDHCTITHTYGGPAIALKNGDGLTITNNVINGSSAPGIEIGDWASYEDIAPGMSVNNADISNNQITGCQVGVWALASNGGHFTNVSVHDNYIWKNAQRDLWFQDNPTGITSVNNHLGIAPPAHRLEERR
jgi:hypothetical protein